MPAAKQPIGKAYMPKPTVVEQCLQYAQAIAEQAKRDKALAEASKIGGVNDYVPHAKQILFHSSKTTGMVAVGGNRSGKSRAGAAEIVWRHLGMHPYRKTHKPPIMTWAVSQELPGSNNLPHVQLEAVKEMAPPGALRGGSWASAYSPGTRTLHWANGGITIFKSYDQDLLAFEGAKIAYCWFDEEPTKKEIYSSCLMRLVDLRGHWGMTFTPVLSLQGKSWVRDDIWENKDKISDVVTFVTLSIFDNPHIPHDEARAILAGMSDEERAVRAEGAFATLSGRVITEYRPEIHDIDPFFPTPEDRIVFLIDPGYRNPTAGLWVAITPNGIAKCFMEHYERQMTPAQHMAVFQAQWQAIGKPEVEATYMDPASWNPRGTDTGHRLPAAVHEYRLAAEQMGADWFQPIKANNKDTSCLGVKRAFAQNRLFLCSHLKWTKWEIERLVYMREASGRRGQEHNIPEKPVDKDNHLTDLLRYLCNTGLFPLEEFVSEPYDPLKAYWAKARAEMSGPDESAEYV